MNSGFGPATWQSNSRSDNAAQLAVSGLTVKYTGPGHDDADAASVRTDKAVPAASGLFYYEVTVISKGREGFIGIGLCVSDVNPDKLPGWEPHSYGYHGDDGHAFQGSGRGRDYGPKYATGDVIGCLWNRIERTISFYKNGISLGVAFYEVAEEKLYPTVGLRTTGEEVTANFGDSPFTTDVETIKAECSQMLEDDISCVNLLPNAKPSYLLEELVFGYLTHSGFSDTARLVARDSLGGTREVSAFDVESVKRRRQIADMVTSGNIDGAISATEQLAPGTLNKSPSILFRLHVQVFLEMVRAGKDLEAIEYARSVLRNAASSKQDNELLEEAVTLLGYDQPAASPVGQLLAPSHAAQLAADLNRAILSHQGGQEKAPLERLLRQLRVTLQELQQAGHPVASALDTAKLSSLTGPRSS